MLVEIKDEGIEHVIYMLNTYHMYLLKDECKGNNSEKDISRRYNAIRTVVEKLGLPIEFDKTAGKPMFPTITTDPEFDGEPCGMWVLKGGK